MTFKIGDKVKVITKSKTKGKWDGDIKHEVEGVLDQVWILRIQKNGHESRIYSDEFNEWKSVGPTETIFEKVIKLE